MLAAHFFLFQHHIDYAALRQARRVRAAARRQQLQFAQCRHRSDRGRLPLRFSDFAHQPISTKIRAICLLAGCFFQRSRKVQNSYRHMNRGVTLSITTIYDVTRYIYQCHDIAGSVLMLLRYGGRRIRMFCAVFLPPSSLFSSPFFMLCAKARRWCSPREKGVVCRHVTTVMSSPSRLRLSDFLHYCCRDIRRIGQYASYFIYRVLIICRYRAPFRLLISSVHSCEVITIASTGYTPAATSAFTK